MNRSGRVMHGGDETGSTLLLTIFYAALALALILIVVASTSLYLERKRLYTVADEAALVGAESFDLSDVHPTAEGMRPSLTSPQVHGAVDGYLHGGAVRGFDSMQLERADTGDGRSATVRLSALWRPPIVGILLPDGIRVSVTAVGRSVFS